MKYTNKNIRKIFKSASILTAVGAALCLIGVLFIILAFASANNAKDNVHAMDEILASDGNHAARPAWFEISEEPVRAADTKDEIYYLITDGSRYHLCGMTQENYDRVVTSYHNGDRRIEGVTKVIIDDDARDEAAQFLSEFFGKNITADSMDRYVGDVHLRATEITTANLVKEIYVLYIAFAVPMLLFAFFALAGGILKPSAYKNIRCTGKVTCDVIDMEANDPDSIWLDFFKVYLTPSYIIGLSDGITALRYDEIKRIFTRLQSAGSSNKLVLKAVTLDGTEYEIAPSVYVNAFYSELQEEKRQIYDVCGERNPSIECGTEKEMQFKYPFYVNIYENEECEPKTTDGRCAYGYLDVDIMRDISDDFVCSELGRFFEDGNTVSDMTLEFDENGYIIIRAMVDRGRYDEVRDALDKFIVGQLADGWGEGFEGEPYYTDEGESFTISFWKYRE